MHAHSNALNIYSMLRAFILCFSAYVMHPYPSFVRRSANDATMITPIDSVAVATTVVYLYILHQLCVQVENSLVQFSCRKSGKA